MLMTLTATIYNLAIELADIDRRVYERLDLRMARQPSETVENMLTRALAYCLEYQDGIALTEGVASGDEPAILVRDLTGRIIAWIEVGSPPADRLHKGSKLAGRAAVYANRNLSQLMNQLNVKKIHRAAEIPIYSFVPGFIEEIAGPLQRRAEMSISITERQMYLDVNGQSFTTAIDEHRLG